MYVMDDVYLVFHGQHIHIVFATVLNVCMHELHVYMSVSLHQRIRWGTV